MNLNELIDICINKKKMVCFTGGGGKTTLMFLLAGYAANAGKKVIVSTTTHIYKPEECFAADSDCVLKLWNDNRYAVIGSLDPDNLEKITAYKEELYDTVLSMVDVIFIEADGAKGFPCKVPAKHEPVIVSDCDLVIGVMGMSALDKRVMDCCFRYKTDGDWLNINDDDLFDENMAVKILSSDMGTRKSVSQREYIAVLNQCDNENMMKRAKIISKELLEKYQIESVCCQLNNIQTDTNKILNKKKTDSNEKNI